MITASFRTHTDAVIAALEAANLNVGDGEAPSGAFPHCIVYPIPGGDASGSLQDPQEDAELVYQVTCVGITREQSEWAADKAKILLDGFSVADRSVTLVTLDSLPGTRRDTTVTPPVWLSTPRFRVKSTPT